MKTGCQTTGNAAANPAQGEMLPDNARDRSRFQGRLLAIQASKILGCGGAPPGAPRRQFGPSSHFGRYRQPPVGASEVDALPDRLARKPNRLKVVFADKLRVG